MFLYNSFSLFAFMPFRVQRKRIKRKGSRSLDPALRGFLALLAKTGRFGKSLCSAESFFRSCCATLRREMAPKKLLILYARLLHLI